MCIPGGEAVVKRRRIYAQEGKRDDGEQYSAGGE